jgi:predicted NodU family carbamoyl transferase
VYDTVSEWLAAGAVVAWYQGGAEMGPRAWRTHVIFLSVTILTKL